MTTWIIAAALVVLAFVMVAKLLPRQKRHVAKSKRITEVHHGGGGSDGFDDADSVQTVDMDLRKRISRVLAQSGKIQAIKEMRDATGWGLKESKDYVDAMERDGVGLDAESRSASFENIKPSTKNADIDNLDAEGLERVMVEIRQGRKINAIKELREITGLGLKESKDLVEEIERQGLHQ